MSPSTLTDLYLCHLCGAEELRPRPPYNSFLDIPGKEYPPFPCRSCSHGLMIYCCSDSDDQDPDMSDPFVEEDSL